MKFAVEEKVVVRIGILTGGFFLIRWLVQLAGMKLIPFTDPWDKAILAAVNPDNYAPGLDQFFRALTDYTNFLIVAPILSWFIARLLCCFFPGQKRLFAGLLALETVLLAVLAALGYLWPNKTYVGVNVLEVLSILGAFGLTAFLLYRLDETAAPRLTLIFCLMLFSGCLADFFATQPIKESVARPRPLNDANKPWNEQVRPIPDEILHGANSFPSGHTSGTFALLTPLFWFVRDRRIRAGLLAWATLQGVSRVYTAAHFPFCCLMGAFLGFAVGTLVFFMLWETLSRRAPEPSPVS